MTRRLPVIPLVLCAIAAACGQPEATDEMNGSAAAACDVGAAQAVVERFGERLRDVPLLAPDSLRVPAISEAYAPLVTSQLLRTWSGNPSLAPGRTVSSPWPQRIDVESIEGTPAGCRVEGAVVYVTSVDLASGSAAVSEPVVLRVVEEGDGWRIAAYDAGATSSATPPASEDPAAPDRDPADGAPADGPAPAHDAAAAADVVRRYYEAIAAGEYERAYRLWSDGGAASGQTLAGFAAGYAETERVSVEVAAPGRVEPAAGSRYVDVPVVIRAVTTSGERQHFEGTYTLRRSVVTGASAEQRAWHIYSADIAAVP